MYNINIYENVYENKPTLKMIKRIVCVYMIKSVYIIVLKTAFPNVSYKLHPQDFYYIDIYFPIKIILPKIAALKSLL